MRDILLRFLRIPIDSRKSRRERPTHKNTNTHTIIKLRRFESGVKVERVGVDQKVCPNLDAMSVRRAGVTVVGS